MCSSSAIGGEPMLPIESCRPWRPLLKRRCTAAEPGISTVQCEGLLAACLMPAHGVWGWCGRSVNELMVEWSGVCGLRMRKGVETSCAHAHPIKIRTSAEYQQRVRPYYSARRSLSMLACAVPFGRLRQQHEDRLVSYEKAMTISKAPTRTCSHHARAHPLHRLLPLHR